MFIHSKITLVWTIGGPRKLPTKNFFFKNIFVIEKIKLEESGLSMAHRCPSENLKYLEQQKTLGAVSRLKRKLFSVQLRCLEKIFGKKMEKK